ncbi:hypothetical protein Tco_0588443 [Tanacetum coccineum]
MVSTTRCLELLHMDLFDPSAIRSYGGNRYTLVIVVDYSSKEKAVAELGTHQHHITPEQRKKEKAKPKTKATATPLLLPPSPPHLSSRDPLSFN